MSIQWFSDINIGPSLDRALYDKVRREHAFELLLFRDCRKVGTDESMARCKLWRRGP